MADVKPISPEQIGAFKAERYPPAVIEAFNELIAENFVGRGSTVSVRQKDAIARITEKMLGKASAFEEGRKKQEQSLRQQIFDEGWLNVEEIYRSQGWIVNYDNPGYNESYDAIFKFKIR